MSSYLYMDIFIAMEQYYIYDLPFAFTMTKVILSFIIAANGLPLILYAMSSYSSAIIPSLWSILNESLFKMESATFSFGGISDATFHLILFANLFAPSTATVELAITLSLAIAFMIAILINAFQLHGLFLLAYFIPANTPALLVP